MSVRDVERGLLHIYSKWPLHVSGKWPGRWGVYTNRKGMYFNAGTPKESLRKTEAPESRFTMGLGFSPIRFIVFWDTDRVLWIGDWKWKADLKKE